ncbi:dipeptidase [Sphingomonas sp. TDK1]|uniref:dipeptidase n=1 Tax=Sphingomonas sp. TDK1 TaxID=453247 RepID=UPI000A060282|nr:dipeptidase [Sphingomonas sp. TDK1]
MKSILVFPLLLALAPNEEVSPVDRLAHEQMLVLDTHLDTPELFEHPGWDFARWHDRKFDGSQVDVPRMEQGGLDGGFFVIYTPQGPLTAEGYAAARNAALTRATWIQRVVAAHPDKLELATTPADARRIAASGKRVVFQSIENSYPLGEDLSLLPYFHDLGVRMAGPVHFRNNQFADSATDKPRWHGFSPLGKRWVSEMNRLGMVIDVSHASDDVFDQAIEWSKTPIIASHSGPKAIFDHPRNLDDARMRKLAAAGGVLQINSVYLAPTVSGPGGDRLAERQRRWWVLQPAEQRRLVADMAALDAADGTADFELFMRSLLHAIQVMGVDHVGIGADWDGGGGVRGMEDITALPRITARLRKAGYSNADIEKIWSGNLLRVLQAAEDWSTAHPG